MADPGAPEALPDVPGVLAARSASLWSWVITEYQLEPAQVELLTEACLALDRADSARAIIDEQGAVVADRYGSPKMNPAAQIEAQARSFYASAVKQLGIKADATPATLRSGGKPGPRPKTQAEAARA